MLQTKFGPFDGPSWEGLCQLVFKKKYDSAGYQQMVASPGDYGIEGFTLDTGIAFQCYCPDTHYSSSELYEKQRDKISADIAKLKKNEKEIAKRLGNRLISQWHFVTPELDRNALLSHARTKEAEARQWNSKILSPDFTIHLRDSDYYIMKLMRYVLLMVNVSLLMGALACLSYMGHPRSMRQIFAANPAYDCQEK